MDIEPRPIEEIQTATEKRKEKRDRKNIRSILIHSLFVMILMGLAASATFWWRDTTANDFEKKQSVNIATFQKSMLSLQEQLAEEKTKTSELKVDSGGEAPCSVVSPGITVADNIKASITSGNTAALEGYMASDVHSVIAASEAMGQDTPSTAIYVITNLLKDSTSPWDFSLSASILSSYGKSISYGKYFPNTAIVGRSADNKIISFSFDCYGEIKTVFLADNEDLLQD